MLCRLVCQHRDNAESYCSSADVVVGSKHLVELGAPFKPETASADIEAFVSDIRIDSGDKQSLVGGNSRIADSNGNLANSKSKCNFLASD